MMQTKKTALITGITGQDGAYLSRFLLEKGYEVHGLSRGAAEPSLNNLQILGAADRVSVYPVNMLDLPELASVLKRIKPGEIYNLAAQSSVGLSFEQPRATIEFNTMSTLNLLEAVRLQRLDSRIYQASSSEMFGKVEELPVTEKAAMHPVSPYAISKAAAHWTVVNYREAHGLHCSCGILFNHESCLRGPQFVTKKIISTAVDISRGKQTKLKLGNLNVARDWGYAPEYVKAMWLMLQQDRPDDYIISTGSCRRLSEFVDLVFKELGLESQPYLEVDQALYRPAELEANFGDSRKARNRLGWRYDLSFEDLIARLVADELELPEKPGPAL